MFAATPPLEAKKILFSLWASCPGLVLDFVDVVRAYFHARARRVVYVDLPEEDFEEGMRGRLKKATYGARDAAQNWEMEYTEMFVGLGFRLGVTSPCAFHRVERGVRIVVHGDDFAILGKENELDWLKVNVEKKMNVKLKARLRRGEEGSVRILNRIVRSTAWSARRISGAPSSSSRTLG